MSVVIVFILVVIGFSLWWLAQQRVMSKPWLEVGADPIGGPGDTGIPTEKIALGVFLAVVGALFALFASAYFMRMAYFDWQPMPVPRIVWLNTGLLVLASVLIQCAVVAARKGDGTTVRLGLGAGAVATVAFLGGQVAAWQELTAAGFTLVDNPANSFFYMMTAIHGLHMVGGLVALVAFRPSRLALTSDQHSNHQQNQSFAYGFTRGPVPLPLRLELCAMYWHFLLFVWFALLVIFTGWAAEIIAICRQILT